MGNLQSADNCQPRPPAIFWSFEPSTKRGDYNKIEINSLQFTCGPSNRKNQNQIIVWSSVFPHDRLNISVQARELSVMSVVFLGWAGERGWKNAVRVALYFFWLYFSLVTYRHLACNCRPRWINEITRGFLLVNLLKFYTLIGQIKLLFPIPIWDSVPKRDAERT